MAADGGETDGFIELPPGILDSSTFKRSAPRVEREKKPSLNDVVFIPTVPGAPAVLPEPAGDREPVILQESAVAPAPPASPSVAPSALDDATKVSASRQAAPTWRIVLPDGAAPVTIGGALFLGRKPVATPDRPGALELSIADPAKTVSKTHALLELDAGVLWVHDLNSTNGVFLAAPGAEAVEVQPGTRVPVPPGSDIELGEFVIQVEHG